MIVGRVAELWRYPVKSLGGERLDAVCCAGSGVEGDRRWAVVGADGKLGSGKTTRRFRRMPGLLTMSARIDAGAGWIAFPDGEELQVDDPAAARRVSEVVGEPVTIAQEGDVSHFDDAPVHLLSNASLAWLASRRSAVQPERRRFRPNLVIDLDEPGSAEDAWIGRSVQVGAASLAIVGPTERCVMTTLAQPGLGFAPSILKTLTLERAACLGVYATVAGQGTISVDDVVALPG